MFHHTQPPKGGRRRWALLALSLLPAACLPVLNDPGEPGAPPAGTATQFANPLLTAGADPFVFYKDGFYYYTQSTQPPSARTLTIRKTAKMSRLGSAPVATVWTAPATGPNSQNVWAPELYFLDGKWYLYYAAGLGGLDLGSQRTFVLENSSPDPTTGTWVEKGRLFVPGADRYAIDGTVLEHPNGKRYFLWAGQDSTSVLNTQLYIAEMANPWTLTGRRTQLSRPQFAWEQVGAPLPLINEGPEALVRNGKVFVVYSASGCWTDDYALGLLAAPANADPLDASSWTKSTTPVFSRNDANRAYAPGHNGFFKSRDGSEDWLIYHANSRPGQGCDESRNIRMQRFGWNPDGSPNFGTPAPINTLLDVPSGE